jgi:hypothetical protein
MNRTTAYRHLLMGVSLFAITSHLSIAAPTEPRLKQLLFLQPLYPLATQQQFDAWKQEVDRLIAQTPRGVAARYYTKELELIEKWQNAQAYRPVPPVQPVIPTPLLAVLETKLVGEATKFINATLPNANALSSNGSLKDVADAYKKVSDQLSNMVTYVTGKSGQEGWNIISAIPQDSTILLNPKIKEAFYTFPLSFLTLPILAVYLSTNLNQLNTLSDRDVDMLFNFATWLDDITKKLSHFKFTPNILTIPAIDTLKSICNRLRVDINKAIFEKSKQPVQPNIPTPPPTQPLRLNIIDQQFTNEITSIAARFRNYCKEPQTLSVLKGEYAPGWTATILRRDTEKEKLNEIADKYRVVLGVLADDLARAMNTTRETIITQPIDPDKLRTIKANAMMQDAFYDTPLNFLTADNLTNLVGDYAQNWSTKGVKYSTELKRLAQNILNLIGVLGELPIMNNRKLANDATVRALSRDCAKILQMP